MARILIIDDEDELRILLRQMLEHAGHEVTEAVNGAEGIELYERDTHELIITDIIMPEMEGVETMLALRRTDPELPIIAISGGGRLDATDFLTMAKKSSDSITTYYCKYFNELIAIWIDEFDRYLCFGRQPG